MSDPNTIASNLVSELPANIGSALALVPALEWAKRSSLKWLAWINLKTAPVISVIVAAAIAAGIHGTFTSTYDPAIGKWHVDWMITGLTVMGVIQLVVEVSKQWLAQHWSHKVYQTFDAIKSLAVYLNQHAAVPTASIPTASSTPGGVVL